MSGYISVKDAKNNSDTKESILVTATIPVKSGQTGKIILNKQHPNAIVEIGPFIGKGAQGEVYSATIGSTQEACVKFYKIEGNLLIKIWEVIIDFSCTHFPHPNLVNYMGFYAGEDGSVGIVMEKLKCDLNLFIQENSVTDSDKFRIAFEIASGIQFLHANGIIHCDINANNILIDFEGHAKLTDFAVSVSKFFRINQQAVPGNVNGAVNDHNKKTKNPSPKQDSYAFGLLLYRLFIGGVYKASRSLLPTVKANPPSERHAKLYGLIENCVGDESQRPTFSTVVAELILLQNERPESIEIGPNAHVALDSDRSPAHYYSLYGKKDQLETFLNKNPSAASSRDKFGFLPIYYAAAAGHTSVVKLLHDKFRAGLHDCENIRTSSPLILAVQRVQYHTVESLLALGASAKCRAETIGITPLHCAASGGMEMFKLLVNHGADVNASLDLVKHLPPKFEQMLREDSITGFTPKGIRSDLASIPKEDLKEVFDKLNISTQEELGPYLAEPDTKSEEKSLLEDLIGFTEDVYRKRTKKDFNQNLNFF